MDVVTIDSVGRVRLEQGVVSVDWPHKDKPCREPIRWPSIIVGASGILGAALHRRIGGIGMRRGDYDLKGDPIALPGADLIYIVASKTKFRDCELDEDAWAVNVDGPMKLAHRFKDSFIVYISSEAAEWSGRTAYGDQKRYAELGLRTVVPYENLCIVRPKKLTPVRIELLCEFLERVGRERLCGIHRF